jgi:hypothetical protein
MCVLCVVSVNVCCVCGVYCVCGVMCVVCVVNVCVQWRSLEKN